MAISWVCHFNVQYIQLVFTENAFSCYTTLARATIQVANLFSYNFHRHQGDNKSKKKAKIRNRYNQVQHLTRDTLWESDKNTRKHHTQESKEASPFPAGDHKAASNRQDSIINKDDRQTLVTK